jgi:hypothetical protein
LTDPVALSESIYAFVFGFAVAAFIPFILLIKQCNTELKSETKRSIEELRKKERDSDFYLEMFHISRRYSEGNFQIKYICASYLGILLTSGVGVAYDRCWLTLDELYIKIALILSGVFFVVIAFPLAWRYITCKWQ